MPTKPTTLLTTCVALLLTAAAATAQPSAPSTAVQSTGSISGRVLNVGTGQYLTNALLIGDMNAVVASVLLVGVIFIGLNLISDLLYRVFDPRTR